MTLNCPIFIRTRNYFVASNHFTRDRVRFVTADDANGEGKRGCGATEVNGFYRLAKRDVWLRDPPQKAETDATISPAHSSHGQFVGTLPLMDRGQSTNGLGGLTSTVLESDPKPMTQPTRELAVPCRTRVMGLVAGPQNVR